MSIVPGSASKLNRIVGISKILSVTTEERTTYGENVFEGGLLIKNPENQILLTDGVTKLSALQPIVDKVYTSTEKTYLATLKDTVFNADNTLKAAYLPSELVDEDGKIKLDVLPSSVSGRISYYANYEAMVGGVTEDQKTTGAFFVIDATDDPSGLVTEGSAMYGWVPAVGTEGDPDYVAGHFQKIAEVESLDLDIESLTPSSENLEAAKAVMYAHPVLIDAPTITTLAGLIEAGYAGNVAD